MTEPTTLGYWCVLAHDAEHFTVRRHTHTMSRSIDADLPCYWDKRTAATARLIAAAPEMLEALGRIEALYSNLRHGGPAPEDLQPLSDALEEACNTASDAIALATNGEQT